MAVFYFLHIPKTAGTTFSYSVLPQQFSPEETCPAWRYDELLNIPSKQLGDYRLFRGHFYHFIHRLLPSKPLYITFLRDPIELLISYYKYVRRSTSHFAHERVRDMSFSEFAWTPDLAPDNFQIRTLTLDVDPLPTHDTHMALFREFVNMKATTEHLDLAKKRLSEFFFVGITERFRDSVDLFFRVAGWSQVREYANMNVTPAVERLRQDDLPDREVRALQKRHALDFELYAHGLRVFEERMTSSSAPPLDVGLSG
jgi:hypothetical protein